MAQDFRRKLTTILAADVAGYSRLMEADETTTFETLKACREAIGGFVGRHRGRVVSTSGDGLLAEFNSVVEAVQCAAEIQRELNARNAGAVQTRRMAFRIGINLGDVIVENEDIYGEGVNVAARLQSLAEPGGICISGTVFDQVRNKLSLEYDFLGAQLVKNLSDSVPTYRVLLSGGPKTVASPPRAAAGSNDRGQAVCTFRRRASRVAVILGALLIVNLITDPGDLWAVWPALALGTILALSALRTFGENRPRSTGRANRSHKLRLGQRHGDTYVTEDTRMLGQTPGNATVARGVHLKLFGQIHGDLTIDPGTAVTVVRQITGNVFNQGGTLHHIGRLSGTEKQVAPGDSHEPSGGA